MQLFPRTSIDFQSIRYPVDFINLWDQMAGFNA
jgi:hypothetical protein